MDCTEISILIADDEPDIRDLLVAYFGGRGWRVAAASDGRAALAALARGPEQYAIVVTDLHMPGADGLEVLKAAKAANPASFVVIITGYASLDSAVQAVRLGAYDYLTKPFALGQVDVIVDRIVDRIALDQQNRMLAAQVNGRAASPRDVPALLAAIAARLDGLDARASEISVLLRALTADRLES